MRRVLVALGVAVLAATLHASSAVSVSSDFKHGFAPATVRVRVHVEPNPDNRVLCLEYDGGIYRRSCQDHIGAEAPVTVWETMKHLPAGSYVFAAQIVRKDGSYQVATITFEVLESLPQQ